MIRDRSWLARALGFLSRLLFRRADRVIVLGRDMEAVAREKAGGRNRRIVVIPNWADADQIVPAERASSRLLAELGLKDKFIVEYSGNMGRTHGLDCLVEAASRLRAREEIHFLFIGWGAKKNWLERAARQAKLRNVTILPPRPREELSDSLTACDVVVISFASGMRGVSVPSRMYNAMAAGKPIIAVADPDSELALTVREEEAGWVVPPGDVDAVMKAIVEAQERPDLLAKMGSRAREAAERKYTRDRVVLSYASLLRSLSNVPDGGQKEDGHVWVRWW